MRKILIVAFAATVVALTVATAGIHAYLGGLLFLANAAGYATLAMALLVPIPLARRYRWLVRLALLGFALATMAGSVTACVSDAVVETFVTTPFVLVLCGNPFIENVSVAPCVTRLG